MYACSSQDENSMDYSSQDSTNPLDFSKNNKDLLHTMAPKTMEDDMDTGRTTIVVSIQNKY